MSSVLRINFSSARLVRAACEEAQIYSAYGALIGDVHVALLDRTITIFKNAARGQPEALTTAVRECVQNHCNEDLIHLGPASVKGFETLHDALKKLECSS